MFSLHGSGLGGGIAIGRAQRLAPQLLDVAHYRIEPHRIEVELVRIDRAIAESRQALVTITEDLPASAPAEARALIDIHLMLLEDELFVQGARALVADQGWNAEWAVASRAQELAEQFDEFEDLYMRERGRDVRQVAERLLNSLGGTSARVGGEGVETPVFVAEDISPADMLALRNAFGFVIDLGGTTSHAAILARSLQVPTVVGLGCARELIRDDDWVILDADAGLIIVAPDEEVLAQYRTLQAESLLAQDKLKRLAKVPAVTVDGVAVELLANIELPGEAEAAHQLGADGVGLFRSEFLFMNRSDLPNEDEQFEAYRDVIVAMRGKPVTIRTLDAGADKPIEAMKEWQSANPALGLRAIRFSLAEPEIFLVQLRAMLRAGRFGKLRILLPMLAHGHEVDQSLRLIEQAREQLRSRRVLAAEHVEVGGMIEVPAAALAADYFARRLDFLAIGTNDLAQYTLAIDRDDHAVAALYDPYHPAVLRLVARTIRAANKRRRQVSVCGEFAGEPEATALLLGMGLRQFSMHPASLLRIKREVLHADAAKLASRVARLLRTDDPDRVRALRERLGDPEPQ
ncbi:MAG: phosphoenolpyruvate--protein phosphotransferase [Burkholderiaceae bacterium]|nr:phosphoenolpyruvate--protein phosphotransferase [Burkholderiaceae bacterium]